MKHEIRKGNKEMAKQELLDMLKNRWQNVENEEQKNMVHATFGYCVMDGTLDWSDYDYIFGEKYNK